MNIINRSWLISYFVLGTFQSFGQFRNILLDPGGNGRTPMEPSIAINPRNPQNMVAASSMDNVYYTVDGGLSWQRTTLSSSLGVWGDPTIMASPGGDFYCFHLSNPGGKNSATEESLDRIVVQRSDDGGKTWDDGEGIGFNHPKDQVNDGHVIDAKGNIYTVWTQFDKFSNPDPNCQSIILFSTSGNKGKKWSKPVQISQTPGDCADDDNTVAGSMPAVFDGKIFVTWSNQNKIFLDRSYDGGGMWLSNDLAITEQPGGWNLKIPGHDRCNGLPVLKFDNTKSIYRGSLYLLWGDQRKGPDDADIWFIRSTNGGDNWTSPLRVNDDGPGKHQYLAAMTVDQTTGYIYVVFYDRRNYDDLQTDVYLAFSTDAGNTFKNVKISEKPFIPDEKYSFSDYTSIAAHKGIIIPIWAIMDDGKTSIITTVIKQEELIKEEKEKPVKK